MMTAWTCVSLPVPAPPRDVVAHGILLDDVRLAPAVRPSIPGFVCFARTVLRFTWAGQQAPRDCSRQEIAAGRSWIVAQAVHLL